MRRWTATFLAMAAALPRVAGAQGEGSTLEARLGALVGRPGGLTAEQVAKRARSTSFDVKARQEEVVAAAAGVDQALVAYFPRLALTARYTRLSPVPSPTLGNLVVSPTAVGPLAPGSP